MNIPAKENGDTDPSGVTATSTSLSPIFSLRLSVVHSLGEGKSSGNAFFKMHGRPRVTIRPKDAPSKGPEWTSMVEGVTSGYKKDGRSGSETYERDGGRSYRLTHRDSPQSVGGGFLRVWPCPFKGLFLFEKGLLRMMFSNTVYKKRNLHVPW